MRKSSYFPAGSQESFIVPLLAKEISRLLRDISCEVIDNGSVGILSVLDCGCGNQPFRVELLENGFQYESLDVSQNSFNNVDYLIAIDCPSTEFEAVVTGRYTLILATEVLEHVSNWHCALANIASCLKPGGYALLTAPFFYPLHEEPYDYCRPTLHQFEKISKFVGLDVHLAKKLGSPVDVIGTTLGAARVYYSNPSSRKILSKIINRFLLKIQDIAFALILHCREHLESDCKSIYLSNVVILRKPLQC